jgi:hypothetical protein
MALVVSRGAAWALASHPPGTTGERLLFLIVATSVGMVVYLSVAIALRSREPREFVRLLTRRGGRRSSP